jgi:hypothetical protein
MAARSKTKSRTSTKSRKSTSRSTARRSTSAKRAVAGRKGGRASARSRSGILSKASSAIVKAAKEMGKLVSEQVVPSDAIALLKQDHREVEGFFAQFENAESKAEKGKLATKICLALTVHAMIEEELLYPPAHDEIEEDLVDEAIVEHAGAKRLIAEIEQMSPGDHLFDAKVKVLSEYIKHHVKGEEKEMFPQLKNSGIDLRELGAELMQRKVELLAELTGKG